MSSSTATRPEFVGSTFVAVCGDSGIGKTSFVDALVEGFPHRFARAKSVTTRSRREGEGIREYDFINIGAFRGLHSSEQLLNADQVHGNWYGIVADDIARAIVAGQIPVKEMAAKNVVQLREYGIEPLIIHLASFDPIFGRSGRELTDKAELGPSSAGSVANLRLLREGKPPSLLAEAFVSWFDAALTMNALDSGGHTLSPEWEELNRSGYDYIAPEFTDDRRVTTAFFHRLSEPYWRDVWRRLLPGGAYLEAAPGRGWLIEHLGWPPQCHYRGLELSDAMRSLNARANEIDIGTAAAMPYRAQSFDGVFGSLVDPLLTPNFLAEALRVLRPSGWLGFTTPAAEWAIALRGNSGAFQTTFVTGDGASTRVGSACCSAPALAEALRSIGFSRIEITSVEVMRGDVGLPPAVQEALQNVPNSQRLPIITTCLAEKGA